MNSLVGFETLKSNKEFSKAYNKGIKKHSNTLITFYLNDDTKRVGFTASKKVGNAIARNRAKRRLRALFIEYSSMINGGQYVFVAKNGIDKEKFENIKRDFLYTLKKLNLMQR